ncbi:MAG: hypothetical protein LLG44_02825 [Chloroflexi bacterium]|nr:hypothetical protein [Chloroflexota bacterium]
MRHHYNMRFAVCLAFAAVLTLASACQPQPTAAPGAGASTLAPTQTSENYPAQEASGGGEPTQTPENYPAQQGAGGEATLTPENYPAQQGAGEEATLPPESYPAAPGATAAPSTPGLYPADIRTGINEVDAVITAALANDKEALKALLRYTLTACTTAEGAGGPPKCVQGERDGSQVEVFPVLGEEGEFARRANIDAYLDLQTSGLYAVYEVPADAPSEVYWPAGQYALIFQGSGVQTSITLLVQDGYIVRINRLRHGVAEDAAALGGTPILAPLDGGMGAYPAP